MKELVRKVYKSTQKRNPKSNAYPTAPRIRQVVQYEIYGDDNPAYVVTALELDKRLVKRDGKQQRKS